MLLKPNKIQVMLLSVYMTVFLNTIGYAIIMQTIFKVLRNPSYGLVTLQHLQHGGQYFTPIALGFGSLGVIIGGFLIGELSDLLGRKQALITCAFLSTLSFTLMAFSMYEKLFLLLILGNILNGIASSSQSITQALVTDITVKIKKRAVRMSFDTFARVLALIFGPLMGQLLTNSKVVSWFNLTTPFIFGAIASSFSLLLVIFFLPENTSPIKTRSLRNTKFFFPLTKPIVILFLVTFSVQFSESQYIQYSYPFLSHFNFSWNTRALLHSLNSIYIGLGLIIVFPLLARKFSLKNILYFSLILMLIGMFVILFSNSTTIWLANFIWSMGIALYFPPLLSFLGDEIELANRGKVYCWNMALIGLAWLISGFTSVWLSHFYFNLPIIVSFLVIFLTTLIFPKKKDKSIN